MDLFNQGKPKYTLPKRPRLFESFAGVGMQRMAFERLGIDYEMVGISEIDKYAIQSYMAIHGDTKNYGDITKIKGEDLPQIDIFTYSFPCQDLSVSGKGKGMQQGTRSGLIFEVLRIMRELKEIDRLPGLLIMENVTALLNKKHIDGFKQIKEELEELGYTNYVDKLNAKNYGVAQNRDRAFMISVLGDYSYDFPKTIPLAKRLKDYLEAEVDEKYYISNDQLSDLILNSTGENFLKVKEATKKGYAIATEGDSINLEQPSSKTRRGRVGDGTANTLTTSCNQSVVEPIIVDTSFKNSRAPRFYTETCPTINTMGGGNREPKVIDPIICAQRGRNNPDDPTSRESGLKTVQMLEPKLDGTSNTLTTVQKDNLVITPTLRIRKLTPLECWRLMGIDDENFHKAKASGVSNSQLYKQAGNGLVVDVFAAILSTATEERSRT